ncbi:MAG: glycosyltransferase family 2 protein [Acidobacteriota bacterium]
MFDGSNSATSPEVSIVVPVYNERENLSALLGEIVPVMESESRPFEIIFVDDGSTDGSAEILRGLKAADPRVRVLTAERNAGQTAAMAAGFGAARGDIVVTLDADLQNDPRDIPALLGRLEGCDAVVGWRAGRRDAWLRRISSRVANAVRNRLSGDDIIDTGCSLKAYRREALGRIKLFNGMHRFLPTLLRLEGYRVRQVKVSHRPRHAGVSKYNMRNRLFRASADLLAVMWMKRRTIQYRVTEEK